MALRVQWTEMSSRPGTDSCGKSIRTFEKAFSRFERNPFDFSGWVYLYIFQVNYEQSQTEEFKNGMLLYFDALMPIYLLYDEESYQVRNSYIISINT